jgi:polyisoprenoid-binding protein YceI
MSWTIDTSHTRISFAVKHVMVSNVKGEFTGVSGEIEFNPDDFARSWVDAKVDAASITTKEASRDAFLRSAEFLDVANYPTFMFKSKRVEPVSRRGARIVGDLSIHGITREVTLEAEFAGMSPPRRGTAAARFHARTKFNRKDFGLAWNQVLETGGLLVGDEVRVSVELEAIRVEVPVELAVPAAEA